MLHEPDARTVVTIPTLRRLALTDVTHEVRSLARWATTARALKPSDFTRLEPEFAQAAKAALREAAMLHLRNVVDFLAHQRLMTTDADKATELVAAHYFDEDDLWNPPRSPLTKRERRDLNRHLAHLNSDRESRRHLPDVFDWSQVSRHVQRVLDLFTEFIDVLRDVHPERARWFDGALGAIAEPWQTS